MHRRRNEEGGDSSETLKADMFLSNCRLQLAFVNSSPAMVAGVGAAASTVVHHDRTKIFFAVSSLLGQP